MFFFKKIQDIVIKQSNCILYIVL